MRSLQSFEKGLKAQASTSTEASTAEQEHKKHLDTAYNLRNQMKQDLESAKTNPEIETLTLDLESSGLTHAGVKTEV